MDKNTLGTVTTALGKPFYSRDGIVLYQGDSLELLPSIQEEVFPLTITSPPYNIGKEYEQPLSLDEYIAWSSEWLARVYEVTQRNGALWLNLGYVAVPGEGRAIPLPYLLWNKTEFFLQQELVWQYGAGVSAKRYLSPRNEKVLWFVKSEKDYYFDLDSIRDPNVKYPNSKKEGRLRYNPLGKNPGDVWYIPKVTSGKNRSSKERTPHPAQFPEELIKRLMKCSSRPGETVLDPFMGSGTTGVVAAQLGRQCVGIELRQDYLEIAAARIDAALDDISGRIF